MPYGTGDHPVAEQMIELLLSREAEVVYAAVTIILAICEFNSGYAETLLTRGEVVRKVKEAFDTRQKGGDAQSFLRDHQKAHLEVIRPIQSKTMKMLTKFSQTMEMKIKLMQQGGLEFLITQVQMFEDNDDLQQSFGEAVTSLFGLDDGLVTQLPLETVLLLGGCTVPAAKVQAAKACVQKAEELASKDYHDNDMYESRKNSMMLAQDTAAIREMTSSLNGMINDVMTVFVKGDWNDRQFGKKIILSSTESIQVLCGIQKTQFKKIIAEQVGSKGLINVLTCTDREIASPATKKVVAETIHKLCQDANAIKILQSESAFGAGLLKCLSHEGVQDCTRDVIATVSMLVASEEGRRQIAQTEEKKRNGVHTIFRLLTKEYPEELRTKLVQILQRLVDDESIREQHFVQIQDKVLTHLFKILNPGIGPGPKPGPNLQRATLYLLKSLLDVGLLKAMINNSLVKILLNNLKSDKMNFLIQEPTVELASTVLGMLLQEGNEGLVKSEVIEELHNANTTVQKFHGSIQTIKAQVKSAGQEKDAGMDDEGGKDAKAGEQTEDVMKLTWVGGAVEMAQAFYDAYDLMILSVAAWCAGRYSSSIAWPWLVLLCMAVYTNKTNWGDVDFRVVLGVHLSWAVSLLQMPLFNTLLAIALFYYHRKERTAIARIKEQENKFKNDMPKFEEQGDDDDKIKWANDILKFIWPKVDVATCDSLRYMLVDGENAVFSKENLPTWVDKIEIMEPFSFGPQEPKITGVHSTTDAENDFGSVGGKSSEQPHENGDPQLGSYAVYFDTNMHCSPKITLMVHVKTLGQVRAVPVDLTYMQFAGIMRLEFMRCQEIWPIFSAINVSFVGKPLLSFSLKAVGVNWMSMPLLSKMINDNIIQSLEDTMVYPKNIVCVDWRDEMTVLSGLGTDEQIKLLEYTAGLQEWESRTKVFQALKYFKGLKDMMSNFEGLAKEEVLELVTSMAEKEQNIVEDAFKEIATWKRGEASAVSASWSRLRKRFGVMIDTAEDVAADIKNSTALQDVVTAAQRLRRHQHTDGRSAIDDSAQIQNLSNANDAGSPGPARPASFPSSHRKTASTPFIPERPNAIRTPVGGLSNAKQQWKKLSVTDVASKLLSKKGGGSGHTSPAPLECNVSHPPTLDAAHHVALPTRVLARKRSLSSGHMDMVAAQGDLSNLAAHAPPLQTRDDSHLPRKAVVPIMSDELAQEGWVQSIDISSGTTHFLHKKTGEIQFEPPLPQRQSKGSSSSLSLCESYLESNESMPLPQRKSKESSSSLSLRESYLDSNSSMSPALQRESYFKSDGSMPLREGSVNSIEPPSPQPESEPHEVHAATTAQARTTPVNNQEGERVWPHWGRVSVAECEKNATPPGDLDSTPPSFDCHRDVTLDPWLSGAVGTPSSRTGGHDPFASIPGLDSYSPSDDQSTALNHAFDSIPGLDPIGDESASSPPALPPPTPPRDGARVHGAPPSPFGSSPQVPPRQSPSNHQSKRAVPPLPPK
jgi:hypothetical protein